MAFSDFLSIAGAILFALGGGAVVVYAFAKWLGGVWANRILENERAVATREHELLIRRRNVYAKLAISLRVFLRAHDHKPQDNRDQFLEAYDEVALWAPDEIMNSIGTFLDLNRRNVAAPGSVSPETLQSAYASCIVAMRKDCGFPQTQFAYRVVSF